MKTHSAESCDSHGYLSASMGACVGQRGKDSSEGRHGNENLKREGGVCFKDG